MPKIMEIIEKETKGKSYHTYKYSYDSVGVPSIDYDDDPNKIMKWKDSGETEALKKPRDLKPLADQLHQVGAEPLGAGGRCRRQTQRHLRAPCADGLISYKKPSQTKAWDGFSYFNSKAR